MPSSRTFRNSGVCGRRTTATKLAAGNRTGELRELDELSTLSAEVKAFDVQLIDGVAGRHHAAPVVTVPEPKRVAEFVNGFLCQALAQQLLPGRETVEALVETLEGDQRATSR